MAKHVGLSGYMAAFRAYLTVKYTIEVKYVSILIDSHLNDTKLTNEF